MKKYGYLLILSTIIFFLGYISPVNASTALEDTFQGGYNQTLWSVRPTYLEPLSSDFGIGDNNSTNWAILDSDTTILPNNGIVMFNMKINSQVSDVIFSCKTDFTNDQNYFNDNDLRVFIHSDGTASFDSYINGAGMGGVLFNWNNSPGVHSFKLVCVNGVMTLTEDNILLSTADFTGRDFIPSENVYFGYRFGDSEFSNYQLCDTSGCDLLPSVTPTPTPTSTPSLSPTPTPGGEGATKVVVVPGMGGSWSSTILSCELDLPGTWTATPKYSEIYNPIIEAVENQGLTALPFYYDWRKPIPSHASELADFIATHTSNGEKVLLVGHSMGGLVGRAYLTQEGNENKLDRFMTVGSPHRGSPQSYGALSGGEIWTDNNQMKFVEFIIKKWCAGSTKNDREVYTDLIPSFYNILPIDDYLRDQKNGSFKPVASMQLQNNWLPGNNFVSPFYGVTVGALSGTGQQTMKNIEVKDPNKVDQLLGNWADGKPTQKEKVSEGDGTVLASSSTVPGATNFELNNNHGDLISSSEGVNTILTFLGLSESSSLTINTQEPESTLAVIADPGWFWLTDPSGNTLSDTQGLIVLANPKNGNYKFKLIPKTLGTTRIAVAQFLKNGQTIWKEYEHKGILPKFSSFDIDFSNPSALH